MGAVGPGHVRRIYLPQLGSDRHLHPIHMIRQGKFRRLLLVRLHFLYHDIYIH